MASIQDRIAALRQGVREKKEEGATDEAGVGAAQSARPMAARARRFGLSASVGITDDVDDEIEQRVTAQMQPGQAVATAGAAPTQPSLAQADLAAQIPALPMRRLRGSRLNIEVDAQATSPGDNAEREHDGTESKATQRFAPAPAQDPTNDLVATQAQPLPDPGEWACESTPPGSAYSDERWRQAQQDNPDCTVFEMIKPGERALVAVPAMEPVMASLFTRSLVVDLRARHLAPWAERLANAHLEHTSVEYGMVRYAIIRAASERERTAWLDGSVLRTADPGADAPPEQGKSSSARTSRFATAPRSLPAAVAQRGAPGPGPLPRSRQFAAAIERMR